MKKLTVIAFLLVLSMTLVFSACGGEKTPEVTEPIATITEAPATTTEAPATTTAAPATTTTEGPKTTAVVTAITREPIVEVTPKVDNPDDYRALYVQDGALMLMDFYAATPETEVMKSLIWEDQESKASERFQVPSKSYVDYIWYVTKDTYSFTKYNALSGGTCALSFPYKQSDGSIVEYADNYYVIPGSYAKNVYPSYFGEKFLGLGFNTTMSLDKFNVDFKNKGAFTVQLFGAITPSIEKDSVSSQQVFMYGPIRLSMSSSSSEVLYNKLAVYSAETNSWTYPEVDILGDFYFINDYAPITYTIALDGFPKSNDTNDATLSLYMNTTHMSTNDIKVTGKNTALFKIGEGADTQIYAIRVYSRVLTEDEVKQNHFADMALFYGLDISKFTKLTATKKQAVYNAFAEVNTNWASADVVALYDSVAK